MAKNLTALKRGLRKGARDNGFNHNFSTLDLGNYTRLGKHYWHNNLWATYTYNYGKGGLTIERTILYP